MVTPKIKKQLTSNMKETKEGSNERSRENKGSRDQLRNRNDLWLEEQKANFEMTYLKPMKLKKTPAELPIAKP